MAILARTPPPVERTIYSIYYILALRQLAGPPLIDPPSLAPRIERRHSIAFTIIASEFLSGLPGVAGPYTLHTHTRFLIPETRR